MFLAGRQQQRHELQGQLWERCQLRGRMQAEPRLAAACSHLLFKHLATTGGQRPAYCIKGLPADRIKAVTMQAIMLPRRPAVSPAYASPCIICTFKALALP